MSNEKKTKDQIWRDRVYKNVLEWTKSEEMTEQTRGRPIIGADIKHFTDYRYRPF